MNLLFSLSPAIIAEYKSKVQNKHSISSYVFLHYHIKLLIT